MTTNPDSRTLAPCTTRTQTPVTQMLLGITLRGTTAARNLVSDFFHVFPYDLTESDNKTATTIGQ